MNEKLIERKLREAVSKLGGLALKLSSFSFTGLPDRMVLMNGGKILFAEIKTTGKKPSPRQIIVFEMFRKLGFTVDVIHDEATLNNFLNKLKYQ